MWGTFLIEVRKKACWRQTLRPGLEKLFKEDTAALYDTIIPYSVRIKKWKQLIDQHEGAVRVNNDGSNASPIDPEGIKDANEYLELLKQIKVPRSS
jgi:hypothetical protein